MNVDQIVARDRPVSPDSLIGHSRLVAWYGGRLLIEFEADYFAVMMGEQLSLDEFAKLGRRAGHHGLQVLAAIEAGGGR